MADGTNQNVDGAGAGAGAGDEQASQQTPPAIDGDAIWTLLEGKFTERFNELTKPFLGQLDGLKKVQGDIDRSQNTFRQQLQQLQKYKDAGLSDEEALKEMEDDATATEWKTGIEKKLDNLMSLLQSGGNQAVQQTVASVFQKYGLDVKNPLVAPELAKQYKNTDEMETAALRLFHRLHTSPQPNDAQQPALQGGDGRRLQKDISSVNDSSALYDLAGQEIFGK